MPSVHPRLRGEHAALHGLQRWEVGSSPPARGTRPAGHTAESTERFIPACAGNTALVAGARNNLAVHPRLRGEHARASAIRLLIAGSSPPARGTLPKESATARGPRFIPACAGNTRTDRPTLPPKPVHPRLRGEHAEPPAPADEGRGSSPPARGTRPATEAVHQDLRFIPACAGNTVSFAIMMALLSVHPRLRGEHMALLSSGRTGLGSSPPARGTPGDGGAHGHGPRFIPACAGNTLRFSAALSSLAVHPRLRGEHEAAA